MVLCVGEVLVDMIAYETPEGVSYQRKAGGAPFNVACAINKFGGSASFVGAVGNDTIGSFLESFIKKQNLVSFHLEKNLNRNTTLAFVDLDSEGERSFCFYRTTGTFSWQNSRASAFAYPSNNGDGRYDSLLGV